MYKPVSTYRIQFHKVFNFDAFEQIIPYLQQLGVKTIYASPIFAAVPGSTHGYDVTDPNRINPEIGTLEQLRSISAQLKTAGVGWLQDIVPNHMAVHTSNTWLADVLENGKASPYSGYFDIDWDHAAFSGKMSLPLLGANLQEAIEKGQLKIVSTPQGAGLQLGDTLLPLQALSYSKILDNADISDVTGPAGKDKLMQLMADEKFVATLRSALETINLDPARLAAVIDMQHYSLCHCADTDRQCNYRRFFTINTLISLNMQDEAVFTQYHGLIKTLCDEGIFQGLRVDHIDGLYNPGQYLRRLRALVEPDQYIVVEKILEPGELLPADWPVAGSTGYDFLGIVNNVLTNRSAEPEFSTFYEKLTGNLRPPQELLFEKKSLILHQHLHGELDNLTALFINTGLAEGTDIAPDQLKAAIAAFLVHCPVYRFYGSYLPLQTTEADDVRKILTETVTRKPTLAAAAAVLERALLVKPAEGDKNFNQRALHFYMRCMQFTGPLMAKGAEDTLMYTYSRFTGHNEVGDSPALFGYSAARFHRLMEERQQSHPFSMNTTATHDTKRGEDVRARLNAITDLPAEWIAACKQWMQANAPLKYGGMPDANDEYLIYQSLAGTCPMPGEAEDDFIPRFKKYMEKAMREAKTYTTWSSPAQEFEQSVAGFIDRLFATGSAFRGFLTEFIEQIADAGMINSIGQLILKFSCPGIPDTYQGCELWDMSMVDPDNRRPVNYTLRGEWLAALTAHNGSPLARLWEERSNGKIKLWVTNHLLRLRNTYDHVFTAGAYIPLKVAGKYRENILAFARHNGRHWCLTVLPLHIGVLAKEQGRGPAAIDWGDTALMLPPNMPRKWADVFAGIVVAEERSMFVRDIFAVLPFAVLHTEEDKDHRGAGILLPVFSLPSPFGMGDFGPEAFRFIDFLARAGQRYWQLLPLNPTLGASGYSPYSTISAMALNTFFISPEILMAEGLLTAEKLEGYTLPQEEKIDYARCEALKQEVCAEAYNNYMSGGFTTMQAAFERFQRAEAYWLGDYALYVVLMHHFEEKPWHQWPAEYKKRDPLALETFRVENAAKLYKIMWLQYIVATQWNGVKTYCENKKIKLIGDVPFYVSHDSVEVWTQPAMFCLGEEGNMCGIAGVPPDYFSADGQLWMMPTFNWEHMTTGNYSWWITRLRRNLALYDIVRLDHFRAFDAYWQVAAGELTASNGEWLKGPGTNFFTIAAARLGGLPFIAEDLGDNMETVYGLREATGLPGMKVLQFAWGSNMPVSVDAPHNYSTNCLVYTGTHDNNTTLGWYQHDATDDDRQRLRNFTGIQVTEENVTTVMARIAYSSVAHTVILPVQDVLGYGAESRINVPGTSTGNWQWRLPPGVLTSAIEQNLANWVYLYSRGV